MASRVSPDTFRVARGGQLISSQAGEKQLSLHPLAAGGVEERRVDPEAARALTLAGEDLAALDQLEGACERSFGGPQDIEWAKADGHIWLLQSRPITVAR